MKKLNNELCRTFITEYIWDGFLKIDGGWGPKEKIQNKFQDPNLFHVAPKIYVSPTVVLEEQENKSVVERDRKYRVSFPGENYTDFLDSIKYIRSVSESQEWELEGFKMTGSELTAQPVKILVNITGKSQTIKIITGKMVPDYSNSIVSAAWVLS